MAVDPFAADRRVLAEMTDDEIRSHARDMIWLAEFQENDVGRETFDKRRDLAIEELHRRGIDAETIRAELRR